MNLPKTAETRVHQLLKQLECRIKVPIQRPTELSAPSTSMDSVHIPERFDILAYWISRRLSHPEMYRLAMVVLSAPSTQVCVERMFSALKLLLTDQRQKLTDSHIDDLMMLKINSDLLPQIASVFDVKMRDGQSIFS